MLHQPKKHQSINLDMIYINDKQEQDELMSENQPYKLFDNGKSKRMG